MKAWVSTYAAIRNGELSEVNDNVLVLTGKPPLRLHDLLVTQGARRMP